MRLVFAPWIIIELLAMGADTVALLGIAAHFGSSMIAPQIGKFLDRYGVKKGTCSGECDDQGRSFCMRPGQSMGSRQVCLRGEWSRSLRSRHIFLL